MVLACNNLLLGFLNGDFLFLSFLVHLLIEILLKIRTVPYPLLNDIFIQLFISVGTHEYLFYSIGHNLILFLFILLFKLHFLYL